MSDGAEAPEGWDSGSQQYVSYTPLAPESLFLFTLTLT